MPPSAGLGCDGNSRSPWVDEAMMRSTPSPNAVRAIRRNSSGNVVIGADFLKRCFPAKPLAENSPEIRKPTP